MRRRKQSSSNRTPKSTVTKKSKENVRSKSLSTKHLCFFIASVLAFIIVLYYALSKGSDSNSITDDATGLRSKPPIEQKSATAINNADDPLLTSPTTKTRLHMVFSTDCSPYMHWQSYLFFYSALRISQPGIITRIASGCNETQTEQEQKWHDKHVRDTMSDRFRIHFTPDYSGEKDYKFFNKPFGFRHFLEYGIGLDEDGNIKRPDDVVILCDPDFLLLRPITDDFTNDQETLMSDPVKFILDHRSKNRRVVMHGIPYAQTWGGLGSTWLTYNIDEIAGKDSPAKHVDESDSRLFYMVGPPYIGTGRDMLRIAEKWTEFAPKILKENPLHHAEMYAYHMAAAHLELPHTLIDSLQISSAGLSGEGWEFFDAIPSDEICTFAASPDHSKYQLPSVIHYCYWMYAVDKYFYSKRNVPHDLFTCDAPLLVEPPDDVGSGNYQFLITQGKNPTKQIISPEKEKRNGFILCAITKATNEAMLYFKDRHCEGGNRDKSYDLWAMLTVFFCGTKVNNQLQ